MRTRRPHLRLALLFAGTTAAMAACATNPATGQRQLMMVSEADEVQMGRQADAEVRKEMGLYPDADLQRYVQRIGADLARRSHRPNLPWSFAVVDAPAVNAFALPGGFIYLTRGILPFLRNEAELANVLGHEVAHVTARHSAHAISRQQATGLGIGLLGIFVPETQAFGGLTEAAAGLMFLKHSRDAEIEADKLGLGYASSAGWSPEGMSGMLNTLGRLDEASGQRRGVPNWLATHPQPADRVARVSEIVKTTPLPGRAMTNEAALEQQLDGLVFGDSREQGLVRGSEFVHPIMQFSVRFPDGWEVVNSAAQVAAIENEEGTVGMLLELAPAGGSVEQTASANLQKAGFREVNGGRQSLNGLPAYVGTYQNVSGQSQVALRAAHIQHGRQIFLLAGLAPPQQFSRVGRAFDAAIQSFRPISQQEADRIQPNRVGFYTVQRGDTWDTIARGPSRGNMKPATLAIMNGATPGSAPRPGDRVRIVAGG